jgi:hypothetical protein
MYIFSSPDECPANRPIEILPMIAVALQCQLIDRMWGFNHYLCHAPPRLWYSGDRPRNWSPISCSTSAHIFIQKRFHVRIEILLEEAVSVGTIAMASACPGITYRWRDTLLQRKYRTPLSSEEWNRHENWISRRRWASYYDLAGCYSVSFGRRVATEVSSRP